MKLEIFGVCEGLFYIDNDFYYIYNFNGEIHKIQYQEDELNEIATYNEFNKIIARFSYNFIKRFKGFNTCKEQTKEGLCILENELYKICVEDNGQKTLFKLIPKEENKKFDIFRKKHYKSYAEGVKKCLLNQFKYIEDETMIKIYN